MTQPTQAQIEAVLSDFTDELTAQQRRYIIDQIYRITTAAAQAGDVEWARQNLQEVRQQVCGLDPLTIERCAQVAENFRSDNPFPTIHGAIASAIRKLKDAP